MRAPRRPTFSCDSLFGFPIDVRHLHFEIAVHARESGALDDLALARLQIEHDEQVLGRLAQHGRDVSTGGRDRSIDHRGLGKQLFERGWRIGGRETRRQAQKREEALHFESLLMP
jgi:hypothetical protein